jgi:hypothetical protein
LALPVVLALNDVKWRVKKDYFILDLKGTQIIFKILFDCENYFTQRYSETKTNQDI